MNKLFLLFAVIFITSSTLLSQSITVVQANGGEELYTCETYPITWTFSGGVSNYFDIDYSLDGGTIWASVASNYFSSTGVYNWTVPGVQSSTVLFRVRDSQNGSIIDQSDNYFTIGVPVTLLSPNGSEVFTGNTVEQISWDAQGTTNTFNLYYSVNNGLSWTTIVTNYSTLSGTYDWNVPNLSSTNCLVRVADYSQNCKQDQSDAVFTINPATPVLTFPNGGEDLLSTCPETITWDPTTFYSNVRLDYSIDNGATWNVITTSTTNDGSHYWPSKPTGPYTSCLIKASNTSNLAIFDISDAAFNINPPLELTTVFTDTLYGCTSFTVNYNYSKNCESSNTYCYYSIDNGATWISFGTSTNSSVGTFGSRSFSIPDGITSSQCKFKVCTQNGAGYCDESSYTFTILPAPIDVEITALNGGETVQPDDVVMLSWTNTSGLLGLYDLYYSTNGGSSFSLIANDLNTLNYNWTVPNIPTSNAVIKVIFNNQSCNFDVSDAPFTIGKRTPILLSPNGGEILTSGCSVDITWDPTTYYSSVRIDYSLDNGVVWNPIITSTSNDGYHSWTNPIGPEANVLVKVTQANDLTHVDGSDASFSIDPAVELTTTFTDTLYGCTNYNVTFNYAKTCVSPTTYCFYSIDNGVTWISFGSYSNYYAGTTGSRSFAVPNGISSANCLFKVCTESNGTGYCDISDDTFTILPAAIDVEVVALNGGETVLPDVTTVLSWTNTSGLIGTYDVYFSSNGGSSYSLIANDINGTTYNWTVPNTPTANGKIKVIFNNESCNFDVSDGLFTIGKRIPIVTSPNGNETFLSGCSYTITWDQTTYYGNVRIDYSLDNGTSWTTLITSTTNDGSHSWTMPIGPIDELLIKVSEVSDLSQTDQSNAVNFIEQPIELTTVFTDTLYGCSSFNVNFNYSQTCVSGNTYCFYSIDNGVTWISFGTYSNYYAGTSGLRSFSVPNGITSDQCKFKVCTEAVGGYCDISSYTFTILPSPIDVTVTSPNGGETFIIGDVETITWTNTPASSGIYDLYYSLNGGSSFSVLASNIAGNSYDWTVPNSPSTNVVIKVQLDNATCNFDVSDNVFEITPQPAVMLTPNGGEQLESSCSSTITWDPTTYYSNVRLDYSMNNGVSWTTIVTSTSNDGAQSWTPPSGPQSQMKVRVTQVNDLTRFDESDAVFSIKPPVELTTVFTDTLYGCSSYNVNFNYAQTCESSNTYCYYSIDNGVTWISFGTYPNYYAGTSGSRSFSVPNGITSDQCKFMVCTQSGGGYCDTSSYTFTILPAEIDVEVTALNGGETVDPDDVVQLSWINTSGLVGTYDVYYSTNNGSSYSLIASDLNSLNYNWTVPNSPTSLARIKVIFNNQSCNFDVSDATFTIGERTALVLTPNGGEQFLSACPITITWDNTTYYSNVRLDFSIDNGTTWTPIISSTTNDGSHSWTTVPTGPQANILIKVSQANNLAHYDVSDAVFSIKQPVELTTVFTDTLYGCSSFNVNFNYAQTCVSSNTYCFYSIDNGVTWISFGTYSNYYAGTTGSRTFSVPDGITSNQCKFKVCTEVTGGYCDVSTYTFTILPAQIDVNVSAPNGGESFAAESVALISWTNTPNTAGPYDVYYSTNGGSSWSLVANDVIGNNFNWTIPNTPSTNCKVEVRVNGQTCNKDASDNVFTITPKSPLLLLPNGGEEFYSGMSTTITWDNTTFYGNVRLEYSSNNGITWNNILTSTTNDGSQSWVLPNVNSALCLVRITETANVNRYDISDNVFRIKPAVTIITPNGDNGITNWGGCTVTSITFDRSPAWNRYNILYSVDGGTNWTTIVSNWYSVASPATYNWTMPNIPTSQALVKVEPYYDPIYFDNSDATFTITKPVTLTQPNFGGVMQVGSVYNIEWNSDGISNIYNLFYSTNNGTTWNTIILGYNTSTNTYAWTVPNDLSTQCLIRVEDNIDNCKKDISDVPFTITNVAPPLTVMSPNGGDTLTGCDTYLIDWSEVSTFGMYDISYSTNGGSSWIPIVDDYATTGSSYNWNIPNIDASGVLVRVLVSGTVTEDYSDALFVIESNSVQISTADQTICSGTTVALSATNGSNYSWSPAASLDNPTSATPIASPLTTTMYYVTSVNGLCSSTDSVVVTVENNPAIVASVSALANQPTTICAGTTVDFTATPTNGGSSPVYDWKVNGISTGETSDSYSTSTINQGDVVTVQMISNLACASGSPAASSSIAFTVNPELTPTVAIVESNDTICAGQSVNFIASPTNEGGTPTYDWKVNGVSTGLTGSTANISALADGDIVSLELTSSESCVSSATANSNVIEIQVLDVPTTPSAIAGTISVCESELTNYSVAADPNVTSYVWNIPGSWSGNSSTNQIGITPDVSGMISVQAQNLCGNSIATTLNVTVNALPIVSATASDLSVCLGDSVQLSGNGATSYSWNNGVLNANYFSPTATNTYTVIGTDANGCQASDAIAISVLSLPAINIVGDIEICNGETTNLIANGGVSYVWDNSSTNATQTVSPTLTTSYQVTGIDNNGCSSVASTIVTVETVPTIFIAGNTSVCSGDAVTLTASGAVNYNWSNAFNGVSQTITPIGDTTLSVIGYTSNGCSSTNSISISVNPMATVAIAGNNTICAGENLVLTASGSSSYLWSTGATTSSIVVSPSSSAVYSVTGSAAGYCSATTDHVVNVVTAPSIVASSDISVCTGQAVNISATGGTTYTWNNGAGAGSTVSVSPTSTTTYTVTGTNANGCVNTDEVVVTVNAAPIVTTSADTAICAGETVLLTASGASTYSWDNGAGNGAAVSVTPTVSTVYTVTGTNSNGCTATEDVIIAVNAAPTVAISGNTDVCSGSSVTLNAAGATSYVWSGGLGTSNSISVSPTTTTTYTLTGTNANGCEASTTHTVTVNSLPSINAGNDVSICSGETLTLNATGGSSYTWDQGLGNGNGFVVSPTATTTYSVSTVNGNGCSGTDNIQVTVNAAPVVSVSNNVAICSGESVDLIASGASSYSWDNGAGNGVLVTVSPTTSTVYTVTGTSANGCTGTAQVVVSVNQAPTLIVNGSTDVCQGESTILNASGASTYSWDNALGTNPSVSITPSSTTIYTVTGTALNGCMSSMPVTVNVNALPIIQASNDIAICANETTVLSATGASSYVWDNGAGSGNSVSVSPILTTTFMVTGTDVNGCSATDNVVVTVNAVPTVSTSGDVTICENEVTNLTASGASSYSWDNGAGSGSAVNVNPATSTIYTVSGINANGCVGQSTISVTVNPNPTIVINGTTAICSGSATTLTANGALSYTWANGLGGNSSITVSPTTSTAYEVTGTDVNGCSTTETETVVINSVDLNVSVSSITLTSLNSSASSYQWIDCDNNNILIGGATNASYTAGYNGSYAVIVTENGCVDTTDCYAIASVGIDEQDLVSVSIFPNPTYGKITVNGAKQDQKYKLFGANGQLIREGEFQEGQNLIDITYYARGIYVLKVDEQTFRISKQ